MADDRLQAEANRQMVALTEALHENIRASKDALSKQLQADSGRKAQAAAEEQLSKNLTQLRVNLLNVGERGKTLSAVSQTDLADRMTAILGQSNTALDKWQRDAARDVGGGIEGLVTGKGSTKELRQTVSNYLKEFGDIGETTLEALAGSIKKSFYKSVREQVFKPITEPLQMLLSNTMNWITSGMQSLMQQAMSAVTKPLFDMFGSVMGGIGKSIFGGVGSWFGGLFGNSSSTPGPNAGDLAWNTEAMNRGGAFMDGMHSGGIVGGTPTFTRPLHSGLFSSAPRLHSGGALSLAPSEVPAILQMGEEVITRDDPRHRFNLPGNVGPGKGGGGGMNVNLTYAIDARGADASVEARIRQAMRESEVRTLAAVRELANRGGAYAKTLGRRQQ